ncbi:hypothetical protein BOX15_Mlig024982g1 [Macrostomum lignano]|uniref:Uncharacterized protein n=1 Tax=Macrostomum lignano TaxID=282301 RepID=A0A267GWP6_9PLAT|nr:hypothetical protein BOX15_Mlig024982g1 [Macrostomum lignano]
MTEHEPPPVTFGRPLGRPEPPQFDSVLESLESGDCGLLTEWLSRGGSPDEQDSNGRSFLHVASFLGNADAAQLLVEASANVDLAAADGFTPLHEAVLGGSERLTRLLLRAGASPAVRTVSGALPMHLAAIIGSGDDIARLLAGPTCAATDSRQAATGLGPLRTPLFLSVFYGRAGAVDALTAAGADSNCCTSEIVMDSQLLLFEGRPAMSAAARLGNAEIVRILLSVAADPDRRNPNCPRGLTPLHEAVLFRNIDVMSHLISAGVNVEITDEKGFTPLQFCAVSDSATEAAAVLIRAGAKVDSSSDAGLAPLHIAAYSGCKEVAKLLIGARANVDITDKKGCTNLQYGVVNDCATEAAARANVDSSSDTGETPLHLSVRCGCQEVAKLLIGARANVDAQDLDGDTPLHTAVHKRRAELVAMLLRAGARVDLLNSNGRTPLALAVNKENQEIVSELIRAGASVDMSSNNNEDLVMQAISDRQLSMARILIDASAYIDRENSLEWFNFALSTGFTEAVQLLIDAGVGLDQTGSMGRFLAGLSMFPRNESVRKLLLASGAEMPPDVIISCFSAPFSPLLAPFSAPQPSRPAAAPTIRSAEEQRQFSSRLSEAMRAAGFKQANAAVQSGAAAALQDILRDLQDNKNIFVFGSFADGWGSSLETLNGEISPDSDIDVTCLESSRLLCLDCGSAGWTACSGCDRDAIRVQCKNGHAYYEHGSTGPNKARNQPSKFTAIFSASHVDFDLISAVPCCRYPHIELLQPGYSNCRGQPSQMSQRILNQLNQEALGDSPKCHAVAASPPHKRPGSCMRVSTTLLERAVMHSLTTVQGQFFILVKFLIKKVISIEMKVSGLKTYMAKNLLFYMLDETPEEEWKPDNLLQLVRQSLQLLVEMMESSDSDAVCMKHFFLRDADVYFKKGQQPKKDIVDAVNGVIDELPRWLHQFQGQLRENASNSVRFEPFQLLIGLPKFRDVQRYSGYSSIYGLVRHCLLKLGSDRRGQWESEHLSELLQLIGELPDCARSARESLRLMAHLKVGAPLDAAGAAAELTGQESSGIECPESPGGGSELLSVSEAKELVRRHLEETDSAAVFDFNFEEGLDFGFLPSRGNLSLINSAGSRFESDFSGTKIPKVDFRKLLASLAAQDEAASIEMQNVEPNLQIISAVSSKFLVLVSEFDDENVSSFFNMLSEIIQQVPQLFDFVFHMVRLRHNYLLSVSPLTFVTILNFQVENFPEFRSFMVNFIAGGLHCILQDKTPEDLVNLRAEATDPQALQQFLQSEIDAVPSDPDLPSSLQPFLERIHEFLQDERILSLLTVLLPMALDAAERLRSEDEAGEMRQLPGPQEDAEG